jgi:hypothetical protein
MNNRYLKSGAGWDPGLGEGRYLGTWWPKWGRFPAHPSPTPPLTPPTPTGGGWPPHAFPIGEPVYPGPGAPIVTGQPPGGGYTPPPQTTQQQQAPSSYGTCSCVEDAIIQAVGAQFAAARWQYSNYDIGPNQSAQVLDQSVSRKAAVVFNASTGLVYLQPGSQALSAQGMPLSPSTGYEWQAVNPPPSNQVYVYNPQTTTATVVVMEAS